MYLKKSGTNFHSQNEQLLQEKENLRSVLGLLKENMELKARLESANSNHHRGEYAGIKTPNSMHNTVDEQMFRKDLHSTKSKQDIRTSSPVNLKSFRLFHNSKDANEVADLVNMKCKHENLVNSKVRQRLLGEIAYQLDRRILAYVFQAYERLYGFTVNGIPEKIVEVSTHPLTGKVDKGYQLHLTQRYADLMNRLSRFGYKPGLHPSFSEFIVNTFGILKERLGENSQQWPDYNNPDFVRNIIVTIAPVKLQKELILLLDCLQHMAESDKKPLLFW